MEMGMEMGVEMEMGLGWRYTINYTLLMIVPRYRTIAQLYFVLGKSQRDAEGGCPDSFVSGKPPTTEEAKFELKDNP